MIYILRFRPFEIKDVALARLIQPFATSRGSYESRKQFKDHIHPFEQEGLVLELPQDKELWFIQQLVKTHPAHEKDFSHFIMNPPNNMMPSDIAKELKERSAHIPTLAIINTENGVVKEIKKLNYQKELFDLLAYSYNKGILDPETCEPLLGIHTTRRDS